jgi:cyclopropane-fatty-acyl-phospholipid synthase
VLIIHDAGILRHVLVNGEVGFGEAYLEGCWESPDLTALLEVLYLNEPYYSGPYERNWLARLYGRWQHARRRNSRERAPRNIAHHYDLGNDFYALWLDPTLTYSSAVFEEPVSPTALLAAQQRKFELLQQRLQLSPEHHLLEIGSGWGGFAIDTAQRYGCRVTSITLSPAQLAEARLRAERAGVAERVRFELLDYRALQGRFDRIVSIEMYEAVGAEYWDAYFQTIARTLRPGGRAVIQGITIDEAIFEQYRGKRDFIQKYIFPGGMLASPERFFAHARRAGLGIEAPQMFGLSYAQTLAMWHQNVLAQRDVILQRFGERFLRLWRYYLSYCECGFRARKIDLMQVTLIAAG